MKVIPHISATLFCFELVAAFIPPQRRPAVASITTTFRTLSSPFTTRVYASIDRTNDSSNTHNSQEDDDLQKRVEKKIRVQAAQEQIDLILQGPNAPFDLETEMKRVESIAPGLSQDSEEIQTDLRLSQLEANMYDSIEKQDYKQAQKQCDEISQMHIDDCGAVLQVNSGFYKAFSKKSIELMRKVWLQDASILCIHPSHPPLVGVTAVIESWANMFESTDGSFQRNWMEPINIKLVVKGTTAIITCDEQVYARRFIRGKRRETELINQLTATNIFRKVGQKWSMVHHHASWHADSDAAKNALGKGKKSDINSAQKSILGIDNFGPLGVVNKSPEKPNGPVKRVVLGTLSDILNGGLGELLGGGDDDDDDDDDDSVDILHITGGDDDDDDDEDDEDDMDEDDEPILKKWNRAQGNDSERKNKLKKLKVAATIEPSGTSPKDALRQSCISALRKLCDQGSISPKQKRLLLTDIISCSAKGEFSMVEVAYELLCGEGDDKEAAEEEFADQCRVFACSLPETNP